MKRPSLKEISMLDIFNGINTCTTEELYNAASAMKLNKGSALFCERDKVNSIYVVFKGKVTLYRMSEGGQKRVVYILNEGEVINEVIFDNLPASINCEAFEECTILAFNRNELLNVMKKDFVLTQNIINSMGRKIRRLYRQLKNTVPIKIEKKVAAKLWKLAKDYGVETEEGTVINLNITVTYLADMLGSARETVSRSLQKLEKDQLIKYKDKRLVVISKDKLSLFFRGV